jgi:hypothetical protein
MVQWQPVSSSILILAENADPISEGEAGTEASSMGGKAPTGQWEAGAKVLPPLHLPHLPHDSIVTLLLSVKFQHRSVAHSIRICFIIRKVMIPYANLRGKGAISTHLYNSDHDSNEHAWPFGQHSASPQQVSPLKQTPPESPQQNSLSAEELIPPSIVVQQVPLPSQQREVPELARYRLMMVTA